LTAAPDPLEQLLRGFVSTQVIHAAVRSGLVDALVAGPAADDELAERIGADPDTVLRLLRGLVAVGLARVEAGAAFAAEPALERLRPDVPGSMRDAALFLGGTTYRGFGELSAALTADEDPFVRAHGRPFFEHMAAVPHDGAAFNAGMRALSFPVQAALAEQLEPPVGATIADIGGGHGHLAAALLEADESLRGIVFDQPHVEQEATAFLASRGLEGRCSFAGGSFFEAVPAADFHLLKWILHDWSDDDCARILAACRRAASPDGRLVVIERPLPELEALEPGDPSAWPSVIGDLTMLAMFGPHAARERSEREYADLLAATGYRLVDRFPLAAGFDALVALPV
jgi:hypothetical protein